MILFENMPKSNLNTRKTALFYLDSIRWRTKAKYSQYSKKYIWKLIYKINRSKYRKVTANSGLLKLHIGCGHNLIDGWVNTDYLPVVKGVLPLDATRGFPLGQNSVDYIYSEHMVEHIPYWEAKKMVLNSFHALKPGGILRIVTPDLQFLIDLLNSHPNYTEQQQNYLDWSSKRFLGGIKFNSAVYVVNNYVRDWGHSFIYSQEAMEDLLKEAGFREIAKAKLGVSEHCELTGLENELRMPEGFLDLESMAFEAKK